MRTIMVCICTWTLSTFHQNGSTSPPWRRKIKPDSKHDPHPIPPYFQYPSDGMKVARVNKRGCVWFLRSIYPVLFGIGRDSKARKFHKAPYKKPSLWYNLLSLLASPCKSLITPIQITSKTTASSVCNEKICALVLGTYLPSLPTIWRKGGLSPSIAQFSWFLNGKGRIKGPEIFIYGEK